MKPLFLSISAAGALALAGCAGNYAGEGAAAAAEAAAVRLELVGVDHQHGAVFGVAPAARPFALGL